jgi:hypothetical protein
MVVATAACVALGLGAAPVLDGLAGLAATLVPADDPIVASDWLTVSVSGGFASMSTPGVAAALGGALLVVVGVLTVARLRPRPRAYETWGCGRLLQTARMEYTATAFANPFTRVFDFVYRPVRRVDVEAHPASRFFVHRIVYANPTRFVVDEWVYRPAGRALRAITGRVVALQSGSANLYLAYVLAVLLLLLVFA